MQSKFFISTYVIVCVFITSLAQANSTCLSALTLGDHNKALQVCLKSLEYTDADKIDIWLHLVDIHHQLGNDEKELYYLNQVRNHPDFIKKIDYQYRWNRRIGQYYFLKKNYQQAEKYLVQGLNIAKNEENPINRAKSLNDMGLVNDRLNNYVASLNFYKRSLTLKLKFGTSYQVGITLNNIALAHTKLEDYDLAIEYYEQALNYYQKYTKEKDHDQRVNNRISHIYEDLTITYADIGNIAKSEEYTQKLIATFDHKESPHAKARALINIGKQRLSDSKYRLAQLYYEKAQIIYEKNDLIPTTQFYHDYAFSLFHQAEQDNAIDLTQKGLNMAIEEKDEHMKSEFYQLFSEIYHHKNINLAYDYLQKHLHSRALFLQQKYDNDINTVKHQIEKQKITHDLLNEQLISANKSSKIQRITNAILLAGLILIILFAVLLLYFIHKKKERDALIQSIKYHEQQLFVMQEQQNSAHDDDNTPIQAVGEIKNRFRSLLVNTMNEVLRIWKETTHTNHIEFAEKSQLWKISIDNGNLRTRSLDKYLEADRIPQNPRWRNVVKTCHFMLTYDNVANDDRLLLESKLTEILDLVKLISPQNN